MPQSIWLGQQFRYLPELRSSLAPAFPLQLLICPGDLEAWGGIGSRMLHGLCCYITFLELLQTAISLITKTNKRKNKKAAHQE